ncbi:1-deoxy-D-xylulose-5-phosphate reductoisomerase [Thermocrinis jamiesonii]|jgi:1-deoxy-D-xylulose 5-phosphate reductoisomerase (EC 1.1.1.267)|uniref:1-deoxy-D-xylulose-5-phosphate reductoisomerase n=1 Tax=Thermocrinis jamiesonii TaxID=1302351 RepID=UPI0004973F8B|nr:1-deoxy-D-xylulose-5-phosphate reductoisomerase [Thermocrinis jamiesonii]
MIKLGIIGSTGSVGSQTLDVIRAYRNEFELVGIVAKRASEKLLEQAKEFKPKFVVSYEEPSKDWLLSLPKECKYLKQEEGLLAVIEESERVLNAVAGIDGLLPTFYTLSKDKILLASNKESIVCLESLVKEKSEKVIPVDSEHNAIFQLLSMVKREDITKIYLTASGGPFKDTPVEELSKVKPEQALRHPRWNMGKKITVDSATLMNKGIELLEAKVLFNIDPDLIEIVIHPQSVVHGAIKLKDGSFIFQVSQTDMRIPIMNALFYPKRPFNPFNQADILELSPITFERIDRNKFEAIELCEWVARVGGVYVPVLLGADERAVELFLEEKITFDAIVPLIREVLSSVSIQDPKTLEEIKYAVEWGYRKVDELVLKRVL